MSRELGKICTNLNHNSPKANFQSLIPPILLLRPSLQMVFTHACTHPDLNGLSNARSICKKCDWLAGIHASLQQLSWLVSFEQASKDFWEAVYRAKGTRIERIFSQSILFINICQEVGNKCKQNNKMTLAYCTFYHMEDYISKHVFAAT